MKRSAIIGAVTWLALLAANRRHITELTWIELLFLFAPLVIFPLGLQLSARTDDSSAGASIERTASHVQLLVALLAVASFFLPSGRFAVALAAPWLLFCVFLGFSGVLRLVRGAAHQLSSLCVAVAFVYPSVGAAWLVASRLGLTPLGFQEPIVLLTAVHFHYAGFAAPLLAACVTRRPSSDHVRSRSFLLALVVATVLAGPAILAVGFVVGPRLKLAAALILAVSEIGLAVCFIAAIPSLGRRAAKMLLALASASVVFSMILAAVWAIGEYPLQPFVHLANMARFHGTANAFGFALCGLLGFVAETARPVIGRRNI